MQELVRALEEKQKIYTENGFYIVERQPDSGTYRVYPTKRAQDQGSVVEDISDAKTAVETAVKLENEAIKRNLGM